jgi:hypothetical protein
MANRSYLYALGFDRTKGKREKGEKIFGLSEYPYSIPLSYKILVSQDSKNSHSNNWDYEHPIAIQGNFEKGRQKLVDFLSKLSNENIFDKSELEKQISETKEFLDKHKLENIILECGEIYEMGDEELEEQNRKLFEEEILKIDEKLEEAIADFKQEKINILNLRSEIVELSKPRSSFQELFSSDKTSEIQKLEEQVKNKEQEMWNTLGINYWSDILYFHFENE